jgi:MFS family permease
MIRRRAAWALGVLFVVNALNFFDRQVLAAVVEPLRREFSLSDQQIGWIATAFTLLYAAVGLPLGRLADRFSRRLLLAAGVFVWSGLTALTSLASGFATLFAARLGVGVGEAVCAPAATSLIGDLFPARRRSMAMSLFMLGLPVGLGLSYALGGALAEAYGWRATFLVAGLPGLVVAGLCLTLVEPPRGAAEPSSVGAARRPGSALRILLATPTLRWIIVSGAIHNFNLYALSVFLPAWLSRRHGLDLGEAGLASGLVYVLAGVGLLAGGVAGDRAAGWRPAGRLLAPALALALAIPCLVGFLAQEPGRPSAAVGLVAVAMLLMYIYYAPVYATIHDVVEPSLRATAMATYFLAMYLLGASVGPITAGALSDHLAARAAAAAGSPEVTEAFRAVGLHQALYVVPLLALPLVASLLLAARRLGTDRARLEEWVRSASAGS